MTRISSRRQNLTVDHDERGQEAGLANPPQWQTKNLLLMNTGDTDQTFPVRSSMRTAKTLAVAGVCVLLLGCGKSSKLAGLLPDAPAGWSAEGGASNHDVSGVGHSSARSYVPGNADGLGVKKVTVQILLGEKGADRKQLNDMSIEKAGFKEKKDLGGFTAYESFALPDNDTHSVDIMPKDGIYVQIVAYKGGPAWDKTENRHAAIMAFADKIDLKKIAAME
jgi:hypothetical protein